MRRIGHFGSTLLGAWVLWSQFEVSTLNGSSVPSVPGPWEIVAAFPAYSTCQAAAKQEATDWSATMKRVGEVTGPTSDTSGQLTWLKMKTGYLVQRSLRCLPDTIKQP